MWNRHVFSNILCTEELKWHNRMQVDSDFNVFRKIHRHIVPHRAWYIGKLNPHLRESAKYVVDLCALIRTEQSALLCDKCGQFFTNIVEHILCSCDTVLNLRDKLWEDIININPIEFSVYLDSLPSDELTQTLLSCDTVYDLDDDDRKYFSKICVTYVAKMCKMFYKQ